MVFLMVLVKVTFGQVLVAKVEENNSSVSILPQMPSFITNLDGGRELETDVVDTNQTCGPCTMLANASLPVLVEPINEFLGVLCYFLSIVADMLPILHSLSGDKG